MTNFFSRYQFRQEFRCQEILVSGDLALVRGVEINHLTPLTSGDPITIEQRAFSVIVRGIDGKWRFARGMTNAPPKEKPIS
jgi:ketosteroid isomerase-like protein